MSPRAAPAPTTVLVVGATSAIAAAAARRFAADGARLVVTGRDVAKLATVAASLRAAGAADVVPWVVDVTTPARDDVVARAVAELGHIEVALLAHGVLPDQAACDADAAALIDAFDVNAVSVMALVVPLAAHMASRGGGTIAVVTSVAGQRGRRENYVYGAAKAALSTYLQGLRSRLHAEGVAVVDIRPGPVRTPMTAHKAGGWWFIDADRAGRLVHGAIRRRRDIAYVPWWWGPVVALVRLVPEGIFKRTNLRA